MKRLRERLQRYGSQTLLTEELLALILSTGSARADMLLLRSSLVLSFLLAKPMNRTYLLWL